MGALRSACRVRGCRGPRAPATGPSLRVRVRRAGPGRRRRDRVRARLGPSPSHLPGDPGPLDAGRPVRGRCRFRGRSRRAHARADEPRKRRGGPPRPRVPRRLPRDPGVLPLLPPPPYRGAGTGEHRRLRQSGHGALGRAPRLRRDRHGGRDRRARADRRGTVPPATGPVPRDRSRDGGLFRSAGELGSGRNEPRPPARDGHRAPRSGTSGTGRFSRSPPYPLPSSSEGRGGTGRSRPGPSPRSTPPSTRAGPRPGRGSFRPGARPAERPVRT